MYSLSKSRYCSGLQCPKMLWLKKNRPEAFDDACMNQSVLETGQEVGDLAMGLFGDYTEVPYGELSHMIAQTARLMDAGTPVIAEASFSVDGLFCSVDILRRLSDRQVAIYEVKSSTEVKPVYCHDASFQYYILSRLGYQVVSCNIVHINRDYVRNGALEIDKLFVIADITRQAEELQAEIPGNIDRIRQTAQMPEEPADDIGMHCFQPYSCGFFDYCTRHLPRPNVFSMRGFRTSSALKLYRQGIVSFPELDACDKLTANQYMQIEHEVHPCPPRIDRRNIRAFLQTLTYPLYFFDFESFQPAVPPFDQVKPFQQIVFQYSLHYIEREGGPLLHKEYLAYPGEDPRRALARQMCTDIPRDVCVIAYNMAFEKGRIRDLAELYPDLREHLMNIHDHFVDLMVPFQKKWYYCRAMQGSYSIKYVLPALFPDDPELDYHNLEGVHHGAEASEAFVKMAQMTPEEAETTRQQLLAYCGLDTYAMVKVWEKLNDVSRDR